MPSDAVTMPADASWQTMVQACAVVLSSCLVIGVVLGILHVSCLICILIDAYTLDLRETLDLGNVFPEWGRPWVMLRVSRALGRGFLVAQTTAVANVVCSFSGHGGVLLMWPWWCEPSIMAQRLVLISSKVADV